MEDKLQKLNFMGQYLAASRSEEQILEMAMIISHDVLGYDHAIIRIVREGRLESRNWVGFPREAADRVIRVGEGISGEVAQTGKTILVTDTLNDPRFLPGVEGCRAELCVPLAHSDHIIGVFNVESDEPDFFTERDALLLETLAAQVAAALETNRLHEELSRTEKLSVVGSMASSILHDIRNDVHEINICSDLLKMGDLDVERIAMLSDTVKKAGNNIYELIEDIFEFVKIGRGKLKKRLTELHPMLETLVEKTKSFAPENVTVSLEMDEYLEISLDERRFRRVLMNLSRNAVEAMPKGGTLVFSAHRSGDDVLFTISDTGVGIEKENLEKIWEPLYTHGKANGTGLGMAIVKKIVEDHGWRISVSSEVGKGTTFAIVAHQASV